MEVAFEAFGAGRAFAPLTLDDGKEDKFFIGKMRLGAEKEIFEFGWGEVDEDSVGVYSVDKRWKLVGFGVEAERVKTFFFANSKEAVDEIAGSDLVTMILKR